MMKGMTNRAQGRWASWLATAAATLLLAACAAPQKAAAPQAVLPSWNEGPSLSLIHI